MTRRLQVLFLLSLLGVLVVVGLAVSLLVGPLGGAAYALVVAVLVVLAAARARARLAASRSTGRTCTCCTSTVHDPIEVR